MLVDIIRDIQLQESLSRFRFGFWNRRLSQRLCRCFGRYVRVRDMFRLWCSDLRWRLRCRRFRGVRFRRGWSDASLSFNSCRDRWRSRDMSGRACFVTAVTYDDMMIDVWLRSVDRYV